MHASGAVRLPARYAAWLARHPLPGGRAEDTRPRVRSPSDGATLVLARDEGGVVLSADGAARFEVDGIPLVGDVWNPRPGRHAIVALVGADRSAPANVTVLGPSW